MRMINMIMSKHVVIWSGTLLAHQCGHQCIKLPSHPDLIVGLEVPVSTAESWLFTRFPIDILHKLNALPPNYTITSTYGLKRTAWSSQAFVLGRSGRRVGRCRAPNGPAVRQQLIGLWHCQEPLSLAETVSSVYRAKMVPWQIPQCPAGLMGWSHGYI